MPTNKKVLIIAPWFDFASLETRLMAKDLKLLLRHGGVGYEIVHDRPNVVQLMTENRYQLIVYLGHGSKDGLFFTKSDHLTDTLEYKGAVVVSIACGTAQGFGQQAVINGGAATYVGWTDDAYVGFWSVWRDYSKEFRAIYLAMLVEIITGVPIGRAVNQSRQSWFALAEQYKGDWWNHGDNALKNGERLFLIGDRTKTIVLTDAQRMEGMLYAP